MSTDTNHKIAIVASNLVRIALGLMFVVFGLNGFLQFMPQPPVPEPAGAFLGALAATGYMFPLIKAVEIVAGALLLSRTAIPFALVLLAPIIVNIALFHTVLAPSYGMAIVLVAAQSYLAWIHRAAFRPLLVGVRV